MLSVQLIAQRTITNKDYRGRVTEQYQINANGDYHGTYTKYFSNGVIEELSVYNKGKITSRKTYEYISKIRYLMSDKTWDRKGEILTSKIRPYNYSNGEVGEVIEIAGLLKNGKGRWRYWPGHESYTEIYNGNDTVYSWTDRSKSKFNGKFLNGEYIKTAKEIEYEHTRYISDSINDLSDLYYDTFMYHFDGNEVQFYTFMYTYLLTGNDSHLKALIIDALDLQYITNVADLQFSIREKSDNRAEIKALAGDTYKTILGSCKYRSRGYTLAILKLNEYEIPSIQAKLLKILEYANDNIDNDEFAILAKKMKYLTVTTDEIIPEYMTE
jgi:hypothetical protein